MVKIKATVFHGTNNIRVEEVERPRAGVGDAVIRITLTTICGTDLHILRGEYPVKPGLIIGHEPVGLEHLASPAIQALEQCCSPLCAKARKPRESFIDTQRKSLNI